MRAQGDENFGALRETLALESGRVMLVEEVDFSDV